MENEAPTLNNMGAGASGAPEGARGDPTGATRDERRLTNGPALGVINSPILHRALSRAREPQQPHSYDERLLNQYNDERRSRSRLRSLPINLDRRRRSVSRRRSRRRGRRRSRRRGSRSSSCEGLRKYSRRYSRSPINNLGNDASTVTETREVRRSRIDDVQTEGDGPSIPKRRRQSPSPHRTRRLGNTVNDFTDDILNKFLDILKNVKGQSTSKLSTTNVVPEFDPMAKDQTMLTWLTKVEECAEIYNWNEREIIHFALPKLTGVAKTWYQGLTTVLYSWTEWKRKLIESFPCRHDYAELLTDMLAKRARYGEPLDQYYYAKINLINRCDIKGRKAVDCLIHGIDDRAVRVGAQAASFCEPEGLLKYLKTVKIGDRKENGGRQKFDRNTPTQSNSFNTNRSGRSLFIKCHNCNVEGHKSIECTKTRVKCDVCSALGHLAEYCRRKRPFIHNTERNDASNKAEKQVLLLEHAAKPETKYVLKIEINGSPLLCQVDLGSQCTLIRNIDAERLKLKVDTCGLPILRGIGGNCISPLGKCYVDISVQGIKKSVEVIIVEDSVIQYPVLLGHTFTERRDIVITKTPEQIVFEKILDRKLFLMIQIDTVVNANQLGTVPVETSDNYTGQVYVNGTVRGNIGNEHYLLPGEYTITNGSGCLLVQNICKKQVTFKKGALFTRGVPVTDVRAVCSTSLDESRHTLDNTSVQCGSQLSTKQKSELHNLLTDYRDCFSFGLKDLGYTTAGEVIIKLTDTEPVVYRPYRMSYGERTLVRNMVQEMLDAGILRESSSPYASPIVLVKKKTGEKRLCVDYRALNKRTKRDHYPLPLIEDQLDQLAGNSLFISLDLASGYYQIPIEKSSQEKTAFVTPDGQFEFTRMPFGLVNAPSVFQRTMNKILSEAKVKYALVYMDDILIPAQSFEQGMSRLSEVLTLLRKGGLTLKLSKCNFFMDNIDFLGFQINADGIKPGERKTEAVSKFPTPTNQHELRQFLGLAGFFRRFVKGFAIIARPLTDLLRKNCAWNWGTEHTTAFETVKTALVQRPLLALYDPHKETQVHTDASKRGIGGILLQKGDDNLYRPVSYFSRKTTPEEQRFHSFELETLAVVSSLNRFRVYLISIPFTILTDCNALRTTLTKRDLIPRVARWWVQLQEFDCEIEYRSGSNMSHADALSRNPVGEAREETHILDVLTIGTDDWVATVQSSDPEIQSIRDILNSPDSEKIVDVVKNYRLKAGKVFRIIGQTEDGIRWVVPKGVRWQIAKMNHDDLGHFGFDKTLTRIQQTYWFPKMRKFIKKYVKSCLECAHNKGVTGKQYGELHPIPKVATPFHTIHADHLGPFIKSKKGNAYLLVIVDGFTKYINIKPVRNTKSSTTIRVIREHISYFGAPSRLITDRGTSFTSTSFRSFIKTMGVQHILNAVATPRANGQVERFNRTILDALATKTNSKDDRGWDEHVPDIQIGLNTTIHKTTGKSPSELLFGFNINSRTENVMNEVINETRGSVSEKLDQIRSVASKRIVEQQDKDKARFDSKRLVNVKYESGDLVCVKREVPSDGKSKKLAVKFQGPYRISKVLPNDRFLIEDTPLTRKTGSRRYESVVAGDKIKPWLVFNRNFESSSESDVDDYDNNQ